MNNLMAINFKTRMRQVEEANLMKITEATIKLK